MNKAHSTNSSYPKGGVQYFTDTFVPMNN